jgi:NADPH-dependent curcumin reductase CurA
MEEKVMGTVMSREIRLRSRPVGTPTETDMALFEVPVRKPERGEVLVRNLYMSVDPYMRGRMTDRKSYIPPFQVGAPLEGGAVGRVVESEGGPFKMGDYVLSMMGWREYFVSDGSGLRKIDPVIGPIQAYLGVLGLTGFTAYVGLLEIGRPKERDTVFVSAASGAVGSVVCQIAKLKGCRVVGSAGSDEKVAWLIEEAGIDAAFNYKRKPDLIEELGRHCQKGIDVYYENVGGGHMVAALEHMNPFGRIVLCGLISQYNATEPVPGPANFAQILLKRITLQGFVVGDHFDKLSRFILEMSKWIQEGKIKWEETVVEGLEKAPAAFIGLFQGKNFGKMLVKLSSDKDPIGL